MDEIKRLHIQNGGVFVAAIGMVFEPTTRLHIERRESELRVVVVPTPILERNNVIFVQARKRAGFRDQLQIPKASHSYRRC